MAFTFRSFKLEADARRLRVAQGRTRWYRITFIGPELVRPYAASLSEVAVVMRRRRRRALDEELPARADLVARAAAEVGGTRGKVRDAAGSQKEADVLSLDT